MARVGAGASVLEHAFARARAPAAHANTTARAQTPATTIVILGSKNLIAMHDEVLDPKMPQMGGRCYLRVHVHTPNMFKIKVQP